MNSDSSALTERVTSSFSKLSSAAKNLNNISDELGRAITAIDYILQRLNLGVPTWIQIYGGTDQHGGEDYWSRDVGYAKISNRWGIALRTRDGNYNFPEDEQCESWLFNDAPRSLRVEGVEKIPDLLEELIKNTEETTEKIRGKIDHAKQLAGALEQAAAVKPSPKKTVSVTHTLVDTSPATTAMEQIGRNALKAIADVAALSKTLGDNNNALNAPKGKK